jgi:hypothetical protein
MLVTREPDVEGLSRTTASDVMDDTPDDARAAS